MTDINDWLTQTAMTKFTTHGISSKKQFRSGRSTDGLNVMTFKFYPLTCEFINVWGSEEIMENSLDPGNWNGISLNRNLFISNIN